MKRLIFAYIYYLLFAIRYWSTYNKRKPKNTNYSTFSRFFPFFLEPINLQPSPKQNLSNISHTVEVVQNLQRPLPSVFWQWFPFRDRRGGTTMEADTLVYLMQVSGVPTFCQLWMLEDKWEWAKPPDYRCNLL